MARPDHGMVTLVTSQRLIEDSAAHTVMIAALDMLKIKQQISCKYLAADVMQHDWSGMRMS